MSSHVKKIGLNEVSTDETVKYDVKKFANKLSEEVSMVYISEDEEGPEYEGKLLSGDVIIFPDDNNDDEKSNGFVVTVYEGDEDDKNEKAIKSHRKAIRRMVNFYQTSNRLKVMASRNRSNYYYFKVPEERLENSY